MTKPDDPLERVIDTLKQPVSIAGSFDARVMAAIEALQASETAPAPESFWRQRRWTIRLSPLGGLAAAAVLAALLITAVVLAGGRTPAPMASAGPESSTGVTQFVLVAPEAESVTLVGDFNDWSLSATRLVRQPGDGVWWITVPLPPGRYRYAFLVNGTTWRGDPNAPAAEDEFGRPNSVVTIGGA